MNWAAVDECKDSNWMPSGVFWTDAQENWHQKTTPKTIKVLMKVIGGIEATKSESRIIYNHSIYDFK